MNVLKDVISREEQCNFAIISSTDQKNDYRRKELISYRISPIFYDVNSPSYSHDWVKIILDWLDKKYDPRKINIEEEIRKDKTIKYKPEYGFIPYVEISDFQNEIIKFIESDDSPFLWWTIAGDQCCGKTRFIYELRNKIGQNWIVKIVTQENIKKAMMFEKPSANENILYVIDNAEKIGWTFDSKEVSIRPEKYNQWLDSLIESAKEDNAKVRLLYMLQSTKNDSESKFKDAWFNQLKGISDKKLEFTYKQTNFNPNNKSFAFLDNTQTIDDIIISYIQKQYGQKHDIDEKIINTILRIIHDVKKEHAGFIRNNLMLMFFLADALFPSTQLDKLADTYSDIDNKKLIRDMLNDFSSQIGHTIESIVDYYLLKPNIDNDTLQQRKTIAEAHKHMFTKEKEDSLDITKSNSQAGDMNRINTSIDRRS